MLIISPKWIYLNNSKLERNKSILIDGSIIKDIIDDKVVEKKYKEVSRIKYSNHILMPTFSESYINLNDCLSKNKIEIKINSLLNNGVTRLNIYKKSFKDIINIEIDSQIDIGQIIEFDGKTIQQSDINEMIDICDLYKSDPTKQFSISLNNIIDFDKNIIRKISSIINEIDMSIHIQGRCLANIADKKKINEAIKFWHEINLLNNSYLHGTLNLNNDWTSSIIKKNITSMISYNELTNIDNITKFLSIMKKKHKCILITDTSNSYDLYQVIKIIESMNIDKDNIFDHNKVIDCVTKNTSNLFSNFISTESINKSNKASFNLFDYTANHFITNKNFIPKVSNLDKFSLTHVWSAGKQCEML